MPFLVLFANPLVRKIGIIVGCTLAFLLLARWYGNGQYSRGVDQGIKTEAERLVKAKEAEWKAKEAALVAQGAQIAEQAKVLDGKRAELTNMRVNLNNTLSRIQIAGQASQESANAIVNLLPGDMLDSAIRDLSAKLGPAKTVK